MKTVSFYPPGFLCAIHLVTSLSFPLGVTIADMRMNHNITCRESNWVKYAQGMWWLAWGRGVTMWKTYSLSFLSALLEKLLVGSRSFYLKINSRPSYGFSQEHSNNSLDFNNLIKKSVMVGGVSVWGIGKISLRFGAIFLLLIWCSGSFQSSLLHSWEFFLGVLIDCRSNDKTAVARLGENLSFTSLQ